MSTLPDFTGPGFFAGEAPDGLTTIAGTPTSAQVRVYWRDPADPNAPDVLVASTQSAADGTWQIAGLNPALRYVVRAQKNLFDDVTVVGAAPSRSDVIAYVDQLVLREDEFGDVDGLAGHVLLDSGLPPFTCEVIGPLPYGLEPVLDGRKLLIEGVSTDNGLWESVVRVTASNGVWVDVPVHAVIGLKAPDIAVRYAAAGDLTITLTLQLAGGSEFADGLRVYRSTEPLDLEALPDCAAELDADADQWVDADVEWGQTYYYAVVAYVGDVVAMSAVVKRDAVWMPVDMAAGCAWFDASDLTAGWGGVWSSKGSVEHTYRQANTVARPALAPNAAPSGLQTLQFDGGDILVADSSAHTFFSNVGAAWAVCLYRRSDTSDAFMQLFQANVRAESGTGTGRFQIAASAATASPRIPYVAGRRSDSDTSTPGLFAASTRDNEWVVFGGFRQYTTGAAQVRVNGVVEASGTIGSMGVTSNTPSSAVAIGGVRDAVLGINQNLHKGDIAELVYGSGGLLPSDAEKQRLEGYLAHKWGLTDQLPAGHPYKSVAP